MTKKQKHYLFATLGTLAGIGIGSYLMYQHYEHVRPQQLLEQLKERLAQKGRCDNAWINYEPYKTKHDGETHIGYDGGITIIENNQPTYYEFFIDKKTGEIIKLEQKNDIDK